MSDEGGKPTTLLAEGDRPGLFEAFGVEMELMIVDTDTLSVKPVCDELMRAVAGRPEAEVELGDIAWSNELTLHVLELKTNGPAPRLSGLAARFHESVRRANAELSALGARLMPGAMHPWMDPLRETRLWPHEYTEVYRAFDRIFGCRGHGWANLQSTHVNLPFTGDEEFGRLHAAVRLVLPLIPALAASSPFAEGRASAALDGRLTAYRDNARRVPSVTGCVVPEPAFTRAAYEREILGRIYVDLESLDPEGVLRHEWVNARGAIARFDRGAVEIRVIDAQECPTADIAVVAAVVAAVRALAEGGGAERDPRQDPATEALAAVLEQTTLNGERAVISDDAYLRLLGAPAATATAGDVWRRLLDDNPPPDPAREWTEALEIMLDRGPLARRILAAAGADPGRERLREVYGELCRCLETEEPFVP
jgi:gamma-glutamyl:cysteine ligase YbdK (ATP-grasp superfamily)